MAFLRGLGIPNWLVMCEPAGTGELIADVVTSVLDLLRACCSSFSGPPLVTACPAGIFIKT
jgi:hypothetical protein